MFFTNLTEWTALNIIIRIISAMLIGALIGIDRGAKRRGGGARTNASVCVGAALVMMLGQYVELQYPGNADMTRMASQVVSGVGFLGAGSIIVSGHKVKGLTSAAGIWLCACIGLAIGIGFVDGAVLAALILLVGLHVLPFIEDKIYGHSRYVMLYVEATERRTSAELLRKLRRDGCKVDVYEVDRSAKEGQFFTIQTTIQVPAKMDKEEYVESLIELKGVRVVDSM